nr:BLUF domain-containing protein [uncultured Mucilaginibacter sp.]
MKNLVYLSTSTTLLSDDELLDILKASRRNNKAHNVSGVLLYCEGTFIQVLEGADFDVDAIFAKLEKDTRHKNIIVMMNEPLKQRNFAGWAMGFASVNGITSHQFISDLTSTDDILAHSGNHAAIDMLKAFIESNKLVINN